VGVLLKGSGARGTLKAWVVAARSASTRTRRGEALNAFMLSVCDKRGREGVAKASAWNEMVVVLL